MQKIIKADVASKIATNLNIQGNKIVLVGGCFDILHVGHIKFLEKAKAQGDVLFVLLESDENIAKIKGKNRPLNKQADRATVLEHLEMIDYIIPLPGFENNEDYDKLVSSVKPAIIATTKGDGNRQHKERQAKLVKGKVVDVITQVSNKSTTKLVEILNEI